MISFKGLSKAIDWVPHEGQQKVIDCYKKGAERIVIACGVRWGKSAVCGFIALWTFLNALNEIKEGKRDSIKIWIVAPSYELTKKVFEYVVKWFLKLHPDSSGSVSYRPFPQIKLAEGIWIQGKSATEPNSLLGEELDLIIMDEAAQVPPDIWETYLSARLISRNGKAIFISTPFGQNWFFREYEKSRELGNAFNFKTTDNPTLKNPDRVLALEKELPKQIFKQNYEASFEPDAAGVFQSVDSVVASGIMSDALRDRRYVMGVDLGRYEDYTVLTVIDTTNNHLVYIERMKETMFPLQKARIKAIAQRYNNARITVDTTGMGIPVVEDLRAEGLLIIDDYKFSGKSKFDLIQKGIIFIEQRMVWMPPDQETGVPLVSEMKSYGYEMTEKGNTTFSAPQGLHDDCVISFLLAIWGLTGKASQMTPLQKELQKVRQIRPQENFI